MPTPSGERESVFFLRNYYDGSLHGTLLSSHGGAEVAREIVTEGTEIGFTAKAGPADIRFRFALREDNGFSGRAFVAQ